MPFTVEQTPENLVVLTGARLFYQVGGSTARR
jgi:hypothetical protein